MVLNDSQILVLSSLDDLRLGSETLQIEDDSVFYGSQSLTRLQIINAQLPRIPLINISQTLSSISLNSNPFVSISAGDFVMFPQTKALYLTNCQLTSVPRLPPLRNSLQTLDLQNNPLLVVPREWLAELPRLKYLSVKNCDLQKVDCPPSEFTVTSIVLSNNDLTEIPCIAAFADNLYLDNTKISKISLHQTITLQQLKATSQRHFGTGEGGLPHGLGSYLKMDAQQT